MSASVWHPPSPSPTAIFAIASLPSILAKGLRADHAAVEREGKLERYFDCGVLRVGWKSHNEFWALLPLGQISDSCRNGRTEFSTKACAAENENPTDHFTDGLVSNYMKAFGWLFKLLPLKTKSLREASAFIRARCALCIGQARQGMQKEKQGGPHVNTICRAVMDSNAFSDKSRIQI